MAAPNHNGLDTLRACIEFLRPEAPYWGEVPRDVLLEAIELSQRVGLRAASKEYLSDYEGYLFDTGRDLGLNLLNLVPGDSVVDVGCGYGALTLALARMGCDVIAVDTVAERLMFTAARCREEGLDNVRYVQGTLTDIAHEGSSFSAVVMNGVLEWLPLGDLHARPADVQRKAIATARSALAPGGRLYLGIENRFSWSVISGRLDHSGLRYTSLMPRPVASAYCRWRGQGYR
ncbi:MAG: class I SAM-dependent methyltransferase [Acidithiobacillus sp.]|uniref:class I SAM-dependent methyltransferase n=1 Tax=Acidithiobacillus sp. TaxID=1872118 RepID=UPI00258B5D38|nr:class I SAM-dependent methyltransferase [Acidithiobacillus sp.]MCE5421172.1 class I SAM-dependent methyltransferase [Acidithiobacillus sp.]